MLQPLMADDRPHWELSVPEELWPIYEDFRNFLAVCWDHLGLPEPTPAQYEIAHRLQYGADSAEWDQLDAEAREQLFTRHREDVIRCFRSLGKSYITSAYAIWRLMRNPRDEKVLVVSASAKKAKDFVSQTRGIIQSLVLCQWLLDGPRESGAPRRDQADQFDVAGASLSQSHSVIAAGITSQITGARATILIADDIEVERNSLTEEARSRIIRSIESDFIPITKTEHGRGDIIFLGTPQTEESVYNVLVVEKGFRCLCIPVRYPTRDKRKNYRLTTVDGHDVDILAPYLEQWAEEGRLTPGAPTDTRFGEEELIALEAKGRATFALQMMLDTSLSDAERYPLKQYDLVVFSTNPLKAPLTVQWGRHTDRKNVIHNIPNMGFSGDHLLRPLFTDSEWANYDGKVLWVDPSGRGKDETAWAVLASLNGMLYALEVNGHAGDPAEAMQMIAMDARKFDVNVIEVEPNFGDGMWQTAFGPVLQRIWPGGCTLQEAPWASGQKERRILDILEPVMTQHRLVINEAVVEREAKADTPGYSLMYQLTHLTRERGALKHDDRIEALAGAVAHFQLTIGQDQQQAAQAVREQRMEEELEDYWEMFEYGVTGRRGAFRGPKQADGTRPLVYRVEL